MGPDFFLAGFSAISGVETEFGGERNLMGDIEFAAVGMLCGVASALIIDNKNRTIDTDILYGIILKKGIPIAIMLYIFGVFGAGFSLFILTHYIYETVQNVDRTVLDSAIIMISSTISILVWLVTFVIGMAFGIHLWRMRNSK